MKGPRAGDIGYRTRTSGINNEQMPPEIAVTEKDEFRLPPAQWWFRRLDNKCPEDVAAFHKWLLRGSWEYAGETAKALLKRFQKPPFDPKAR